MKQVESYIEVIGRTLIGGLFAYAGFGKILGFAGTAGWMASAGLPFAQFLLVLTIILELIGGIMLIVGYKTKIVSYLLAGFVVLATAIFHTDFTVQNQTLLFNKNIMIIGGLLILASRKPGKISLDRKFSK